MAEKPRRPRAWLALLLLLGIYRLGLLDRGAQSIGDELLYYQVPVAIELALQGESASALRTFEDSLGRPGQMLLSLPPAAVQLVLHRWLGLPVACPESLWIPGVANVLFSLLGAAALHLIARRLLRAEGPALCVTAVYGLLASSNLYLRHLLPYESSLALGLLALAFALRPGGGTRHDFATGLLLGLAYGCYPGYYPLLPLVLTVVAARPGPRGRALLWVCAGGLACALLFESISAAAGKSYLRTLRGLSGTINLGSFEEAWWFLPRHLFATQGPWCAPLLGLALAWPVLATRKASRPLIVVLSVAAACYAWHGTLSWLEKMVFYGRLVHLYHPFLVLAAVGSACALPRRWRQVAVVVLLLGSLVGFLRFAFPYQRLAYPRDVLYREGVWNLRHPPERTVFEFPPYRPIISPPSWSRSSQRYREDPALTLVNFAYFAPVIEAQHRGFTPPQGARRVFDGLHYLSFPAYGFEGHGVAERASLWQHAPRIQIWAPE